MSTPELITAGKDVMLAVAAATTAIVAVMGLKSWSHQLRGTASFEVARALAKASYKLRDEISVCRSPLIQAHEFPDEYRKKMATSSNTPDDNGDAYRYVFRNRWSSVYTAAQEFDTHALEAEALWGEAIRDKADRLNFLVRKLQVSIESYISDAASGGSEFRADPGFGQQVRKDVFAYLSDTENDLSNKIVLAIKEIEGELRPHLKRN